MNNLPQLTEGQKYFIGVDFGLGSHDIGITYCVAILKNGFLEFINIKQINEYDPIKRKQIIKDLELKYNTQAAIFPNK